MADQPKTEFTPEELRQSKGDYDPSKLVPGSTEPVDHGGKPQPTHQEIAEQQRLEQKAVLDGRDRKDKLVDMGRGQQTTGRLGGNH